MSRLSPNLVLRIIAGTAQLGALYLATHAVGTAVGWRVMADAEPLDLPAADGDDDDDDDDDKGTSKPAAKGKYEYAQRAPNALLTEITGYNVFCPTCVPVVETATPDGLGLGPASPTLADTEFPSATKTQLPLALVATMEAEEPGISLATISYADGGTGVFAEGDGVLDNVTLLSVHLGLVYLQNASRVEYLPLSSGDVPPPKAKKEPTDPKPAAKKNKYAIDGASDAIKCTGNSCTVERKFINQLLANPAMLATQARPRPYDKRGLKGFQLTRIRKGSIPYMLGIRSGNVIKAINGQELQTLDGAVKLYPRLRNASNLSVDYVQGIKGELYEKRLEIEII